MSTPSTIPAFEPLFPSLAEDPFTQLERIFTYYLQSFFEHAVFEGTGMHWILDDKTTEMIISAEKPRLESIDKRPHITVVMGGSKWGQIGLDQMQKLVVGTGQRTHTDLISSTVAFHCQAKEGTQARRMAWYASWGTILFRRLIMKQGKLHQVGMDHDITAESAPTAYTGPRATEEIVSVVVTVPFFWQPQWVIRDPAPVFRRLDFTLNVQPVVPKPFMVRGREVRLIPMDPPPATAFQTGIATED